MLDHVVTGILPSSQVNHDRSQITTLIPKPVQQKSILPGPSKMLILLSAVCSLSHQQGAF